MKIHDTAVVSKKAEIAEGVSIGPYSVINDNVKIGANTIVGAHCIIDEFTAIGKDCSIFSGAIVGSISQDKKFKGKKSFLEIGDRNIIREYSTINRGTDENSKTSIGNDNLLMAYSHIAHDCLVADNVVIANCGTLAGHVILERGVIVGGLTAIHQFVRIGELSIIGGCSKVVQDIVPYSMSDGHPAKVFGVNSTGLERADFSDNAKENLKKAFKMLFSMKLNLKNALAKIKNELPQTKEITSLMEFITSSERGIAR